MKMQIQYLMDVMLTTGGKKWTLRAQEANCGLDSLYENNECTFSSGKVPRGMRIKLKTKIGLKGEKIQYFDGCSA